jgi:hypothetical protein
VSYGPEPSYGGPAQPPYGGPQTPAPPPVRRRPIVWGVAVGVVLIVLVLVGLYSCQGPTVTPPAASSSPITSPATTAGTMAPVVPTAVEAGSGGQAGEAPGPGIGGLALGTAGMLLAGLATVTLLRRRSGP